MNRWPCHTPLAASIASHRATSRALERTPSAATCASVSRAARPTQRRPTRTCGSARSASTATSAARDDVWVRPKGRYRNRRDRSGHDDPGGGGDRVGRGVDPDVRVGVLCAERTQRQVPEAGEDRGTAEAEVREPVSGVIGQPGPVCVHVLDGHVPGHVRVTRARSRVRGRRSGRSMPPCPRRRRGRSRWHRWAWRARPARTRCRRRPVGRAAARGAVSRHLRHPAPVDDGHRDAGHTAGAAGPARTMPSTACTAARTRACGTGNTYGIVGGRGRDRVRGRRGRDRRHHQGQHHGDATQLRRGQRSSSGEAGHPATAAGTAAGRRL